MPYPGPENPPPGTPFDWLRREAVVALLHPQGGRKSGGGSRLVRVIRRFWGGINWIYFAGLMAILIILQLLGERHWLTSSVLFLPQQGWLLPVLVLAPLNLLARHWRGLLLNAVAVVIVFGPYMHYRIGPSRSAGSATSGKPGLTILTNNRGESNHQTITPYLELVKPDIIAYEDLDGHEMEYAETYPDLHVDSLPGAILITRFAILDKGSLDYPGTHFPATVPWFTLDYDGTPIKVYVVHFPSPRDMLLSLQGRGFLYELFGLRRRVYGDDYRGYPVYLAERLAATEAFAAHLRTETLPYLVVGDFNMPDRGYQYRMMAGDGRRDAFAVAGSGYGFSFPGTSSQVMSGFGPWLRLDYVFAGPAWQVDYAEVEPARKSQHRAVWARVHLSPGQPTTSVTSVTSARPATVEVVDAPATVDAVESAEATEPAEDAEAVEVPVAPDDAAAPDPDAVPTP